MCFSRLRFRGLFSSDAHLVDCLRTHCASLRPSTDLYDRCVHLHCQPPLPAYNSRTVRSTDFPVSIVQVGLPWSFQRSPMVLCPASSLSDDQVLRYCTAEACYTVTSGHADGTAMERIEQIDGSRCLRMCDDMEGRYEDCVTQECCLVDASDQDSNPQPMTRRRRVNDDVSQCIQSYCSGKLFRERILCIVKNCNRSVLTS